MIACIALLLLAQDDGFSLNRGPVRFRNVEVRAGILQISDADLSVGDLHEIESDGLNPDRFARLVLKTTESLDAVSFGVRFDFNLFRLAVDGFLGDWEGDGTLSYGQIGGPTTTVPVDLEGDAWGCYFTFEYPALRYRTPTFEGTLGPVLGVNWVHQEVEDVPASPIAFDGEVDALVGSLGLRLDLAVRFDRWEISGEVEPGFAFGQLQGMELRAALGVGLRF
jgi:hypothetical protein